MKIYTSTDNNENSETKCCFQFNYDFKDVYKNDLAICSVPTDNYICEFQNKFIQETVKENCLDKVRIHIQYIYDHFNNAGNLFIGNLLIYKFRLSNS